MGGPSPVPLSSCTHCTLQHCGLIMMSVVRAGRDEQEKEQQKRNKHTLAAWRKEGRGPRSGTWVLGYGGTWVPGYLVPCGRVKASQGWKRARANRRAMEKAGAGMDAAWGRGGQGPQGAPLLLSKRSRGPQCKCRNQIPGHLETVTQRQRRKKGKIKASFFFCWLSFFFSTVRQ